MKNQRSQKVNKGDIWFWQSSMSYISLSTRLTWKWVTGNNTKGEAKLHTRWCISSNSSRGVDLSDIACGVSFKFSSRYRKISHTHSIKASNLRSDAGNAACNGIRWSLSCKPRNNCYQIVLLHQSYFLQTLLYILYSSSRNEEYFNQYS